MEKSAEFPLHFIIALQLLHLQVGRGVIHGEVKGGGEKLEVYSQLPDSCVCMHVCHENVFALQLHDEDVQVCSDAYEQGQASEPLRV